MVYLIFWSWEEISSCTTNKAVEPGLQEIIGLKRWTWTFTVTLSLKLKRDKCQWTMFLITRIKSSASYLPVSQRKLSIRFLFLRLTFYHSITVRFYVSPKISTLSKVFFAILMSLRTQQSELCLVLFWILSQSQRKFWFLFDLRHLNSFFRLESAQQFPSHLFPSCVNGGKEMCEKIVGEQQSVKSSNSHLKFGNKKSLKRIKIWNNKKLFLSQFSSHSTIALNKKMTHKSWTIIFYVIISLLAFAERKGRSEK